MKHLKTTFLIIGIMLVTITISAQQPASKPVPATQASVKLTSPTDTVQYTLGAYIGQWMVKG